MKLCRAWQLLINRARENWKFSIKPLKFYKDISASAPVIGWNLTADSTVDGVVCPPVYFKHFCCSIHNMVNKIPYLLYMPSV